MSRRGQGLGLLVLLGLLLVGWFMWSGVRRAEVHHEQASAVSKGPVVSSSPDRAPELDAVLTETDPGRRSGEFGSLFKQWLDADPEAALAYLQRMPRGAEFTNGLLMVLKGLAETDPARAVELAATLATGREQWMVYNALFDQLARKDRKLALELLEQVPEGEPRLNAIRAIMARWTSSDKEASLAWARGLENADERAAACETLLAIVSKSDPLRALSLAPELLSGGSLDRMLSQSLRRLTEIDPDAASRIVSQWPAGSLQTEAALQVVRELAAQNPTAALAWLKTLPEDLQQLALHNLLDSWSKSDPAAARNHVSQMPVGAAQDAAAGHLALGLVSDNPTEAFDWVMSLESTSARNAALLGMTTSWARRDPVAATRWAEEFPADSPVRLDAIRDALSYWSLEDATAAANFVKSLPESEQPQAIQMVAPGLAQQDVAAALAWANTLGTADLKELAVDAVVTRWADNQPAIAAVWVAAQIEGPARVDQARTVTERWLVEDSKSALTWVRSLPAGPSRDGAADVVAARLAVTDPGTATMFAAMIQSTALREARTKALAGK